MRKVFFISFSLGAILVISAVVAVGQQAGDTRSPAEQQMLQGRQNQNAKLEALLQHDLGISDDEMAVIGPKFEAIVATRVSVAVAFGPLFALPSRAIPAQDALPDLRKAYSELTQVEKDPATTPAQVQDKIEALRQIRSKNQTDLQLARDDLRKVTNTREEAMLMVWGILN